MKKETAFWMAMAIATVSAVFAMFAFSQPTTPLTEPAPVTTPTVEPIVITIPAPTDEAPAKFKVGDAVVIEGAPPELDAKVFEVLGMQPWTNNATGETAEFMTYLVEISTGTETGIVPVPEQFMTAK